MVLPGSELQTHDWLQARTGLGELLDYDFGRIRLTRWYMISDQLLQHQSALDTVLGAQEQTLFDLQRGLVLYDLTNTYFEGPCTRNPKAPFGRSKEKLKCCPWVTLDLVLDDKGFPLGSQGFPGNASEPATLPLMLDGLNGKNPLPGEKPVIIMDAGIASADNIAWLTKRDYLYRVVSRERDVQAPRDPDNAVLVRETGQHKVTVYRALDAETGKTRLYCHSGQKAKKEQAIRNRFPVRLEAALDKLNTGLDKKARSKTSRKYSNALAGYVKKTAASHQITVSRSLPMMKKTTPSVSNGCVNPKVNKKTSTAVFTA